VIAIVNTGGANVASIRLALARLGHKSMLTADPAVIRAAEHVILPGVGAAADAMERLHSAGLIELLPHLPQSVLGICLGMQLLYERSEEGRIPCLGVFSGEVQRFSDADGLPTPHMGWNRLDTKRGCLLLRDIPADARMYFAHSFAAPVTEDTVASARYGSEFAAVAQRGNFYATQFHPERSGAAGARLLQNFVAL
jgi:glutamine amidotransferase